MKNGDLVKYLFPSPKTELKREVSAVVTFVGSTVIFLKCEDGSILKVSFKNFDRIIPVEHEELKVEEMYQPGL